MVERGELLGGREGGVWQEGKVRHRDREMGRDGYQFILFLVKLN